MSYPKHPAPYTTGVKITRFVPGAAPAMGGFRAIIGGTAAAAKNIKLVKVKKIERQDVVKLRRSNVGIPLRQMLCTPLIIITMQLPIFRNRTRRCNSRLPDPV